MAPQFLGDPLGTFHSICLRWLQDHQEFTRLKRNFTVLDEFDQHYFVYQNFSDFDALTGISHLIEHEATSTWDRSEKLVKLINMVSEEALNIQTLLAAPDAAVQALGRCAQLYHQKIAEANALDFSTIQSEALQLLHEHPDVRNALKEHITYVMVDEYQDTNTIQEHILLELVGTDNPNLCVVGDDDQGIYRFRGATIRNILQFGTAFSGPCKRIALEINYRSHEAIIEFCTRWMGGQEWMYNSQQFRYPKQIVARSAEFPALPAVVRVSAQSDAAWQEEVLAFLQALRTTGQLTDWNQAAFLFRSVKNPNVRALAAYLEQHGIPVYSPRANQFFDREEVRLMIGALIFLFPQFSEARKWQADAHLLALRWSDIDFKNNSLQVRRTVDFIAHYGYVETEPKTAKSKRQIALPPLVIEVLKRHRVQQLEQRLQVGEDWQESDLMFTGLQGGYLNPRYILKLFDKLLKEANLPHIRFHDLRHSAATMLLSMGVEMKVIQEILGHSNIAMTADVYSHVSLTMQKAAMDKWSGALGDENGEEDTGGK